MTRPFTPVLAMVVLAVGLGSCSTVSGLADQQALDQAPPAALALETPAVTSLAVAQTPSTQASEGHRQSYRRAATVEIEPLTVPLLPVSVPIEDGTQIAAMPTSLGSIEVFEMASEYGELKTTLSLYDEFNQPRVFRIVGESGDFYNVQVPMRPNGSTGYIRKSDVDVTATDQRILIDLSDRSVTVWDGDDIVFDTTGTIGKASSPTPTGSFYVRNVFEWYADSIYGPYVIPLSAYSESIDQINGGDAVVAIHGTQRPDLMGAAASLGCVRLENDVLRELAVIIEPGAPVEVVE